jgi:hypothetical protein
VVFSDFLLPEAISKKQPGAKTDNTRGFGTREKTIAVAGRRVE